MSEQEEIPAALPTAAECSDTIDGLGEHLESEKLRLSLARAQVKVIGKEVRDAQKTLDKWLGLQRRVRRLAKQGNLT